MVFFIEEAELDVQLRQEELIVVWKNIVPVISPLANVELVVIRAHRRGAIGGQ